MRASTVTLSNSAVSSGAEIRVRRVVFVDDEQIHAVLEHGQVVFLRACSGGRGGQYGGLRQGILQIFGGKAPASPT